MKTAFLLAAIFCFLWGGYVEAKEVQVSAVWAFNGTNTEGGFRLYLQRPNSTDWALVQDIEGVGIRTWAGTMDIENGRNVFVMTAYDGEQESEHSAEFPFEYLDISVGRLPAPQIILNFNFVP